MLSDGRLVPFACSLFAKMCGAPYHNGCPKDFCKQEELEISTEGQKGVVHMTGEAF